MSAEHAQMARLARVTGLALEAAQGRLRRASTARRAIEAEIAALDARLAGTRDSTDSLASLCGAAARWRMAMAQRRGALMARLAQARATEEEARRAAAHAFGRDAAMARLQARAGARAGGQGTRQG